MKRSNESKKVMRRRTTIHSLGNSRYAQKVARGNQMYGDGSRPGKGCCANSHLFGVKK